MGGAGRWRVGVSGVAGAWPQLVSELVPRCSFPPPGSALDCAVSGGPDSLALLVLAAAAGCAVTAIHVDHGLRAGSEAEATVVAAGGGARRRALRGREGLGRRRAESRGTGAGSPVRRLAPGVATGHTMDDQAETILLNLLRGSGADGLAGMEPGTRHPLLGLRRQETHAVCAAMGLEPVRDPSNDDPSFLRNRVRHELLPLCADVAGRDPVPLLARQAGVLRDEVTLLNGLAREAAPDPEDARALAALPVALARRAVRQWLQGAGGSCEGGVAYPPSSAEVERVMAVAAGASGGHRALRGPPGLPTGRTTVGGTARLG